MVVDVQYVTCYLFDNRLMLYILSSCACRMREAALRSELERAAARNEEMYTELRAIRRTCVQITQLNSSALTQQAHPFQKNLSSTTLSTNQIAPFGF